jgi:hypothetical protein
MNQQRPEEWGGLLSVSSPAAVMADHVDDLVQVPAHDLPRWLTGLDVPAGWRLAAVDGQGFRPARTAVRVPSPDGAGYGCDTVSLYRFTGVPATEFVVSQADCALRDVHAESITTRVLVTPSIPGVAAVCASGHFTTGGLLVWGQYCTYVAGSSAPGQGMLIEHSLFVDSGCLTTLAGDVVALSRAIHTAFINTVAAG